jgi:F-type H+-transporting ATPase subunit b
MKKLALLALIFFVLSAPTLVRAQEHSEAGAQSHEESIWPVVFRWANFAALVGLVGYFLKKPATEFFESRKNEIHAGLDRAARAQEDADGRMSEIEQRLGRLSTDLTALRAQAEAESKRDRDNLIDEARREIDRVVEQSRQDIDRVAKSIEREIRQKVATDIVDQASHTLQTEMTPSDHHRIVVRFLKNL